MESNPWFKGRLRIKCPHCEALVINGNPTHEFGCLGEYLVPLEVNHDDGTHNPSDESTCCLNRGSR